METEAVIKRSSSDKPYRQLTTTKTVLIAVLVAVVGLVMLYFGGLNLPWEGAKALLNNLGSAFIVSVGLALVWDLWGRRAFSREILETARSATEVEAAGLVRIGTNYVEDPDWEDLFRNVRKLDVFVAYGRTWRNAQISRLTSLSNRSDARIRIYLPDPADSETIKHLADRFSMEYSDLVAAIKESRREFAKLQKPGGAKIEVYYRTGDVVFSCYRFDKTAILTLYSHSRKRSQVPTLVCRDGGSLYQFVREELKAIEEQSKLAN
ncbi:hypothetical protein [Nonomuraea indica]|uniref:hypothetical protein n=1 Tax=Nonomuraea indica TaxID=1581193 RepID=UPI0015DF5568|nr:hypothetical protein [Nonomuraea indica]